MVGVLSGYGVTGKSPWPRKSRKAFSSSWVAVFDEDSPISMLLEGAVVVSDEDSSSSPLMEGAMTTQSVLSAIAGKGQVYEDV